MKLLFSDIDCEIRMYDYYIVMLTCAGDYQNWIKMLLFFVDSWLIILEEIPNQRCKNPPYWGPISYTQF